MGTPQRKPRLPSPWSSRRLPRPTEVEPESTCQSSLTSNSSTLWWMTCHSGKQVVKKCRYKDTKLKKSPDPQLLLHSEYSFLSQVQCHRRVSHLKMTLCLFFKM